MLRPDYSEFEGLAKTGTLVPVAKAIRADLQTPVSAFLSVAADEPYAFLLESNEGGEKIGRYTFLGFDPYMIVSARGDKVTIERGRKRERRKQPVLEVVRELLGEHKSATVPGLPPFTAGAVGFFAYDWVRQLEKLPKHAKDDLDAPDCVLMFFDRLLAFDHLFHQIYVIATADVRSEKPCAAYERALRRIDEIEQRLEKGVPSRFRRNGAPKQGELKLRSSLSPADYMRAVEATKESIAAGDIFQGVLAQRWEFTPEVPPFDIYRALRAVNPSPYLYFLRMGERHVVGSSPEMLVKVTGRKLEYRPIAGTHRRGKTEAEDRAIEAKLRGDEKERAEHVMLVDLGRNDIGRVSTYGSVKVANLMFVERYSHVMHLVSAIEGELRPELTALDAFAACFPAGTLTGAPKVRAMEIIEELEPVRRGVYGGSVLYADFAGNLDSCIAIRTMYLEGKKGYLEVGAGIVADSVPESEHEECVNKAAAVLKSVEIARGRSG